MAPWVLTNPQPKRHPDRFIHFHRAYVRDQQAESKPRYMCDGRPHFVLCTEVWLNDKTVVNYRLRPDVQFVAVVCDDKAKQTDRNTDTSRPSQIELMVFIIWRVFVCLFVTNTGWPKKVVRFQHAISLEPFTEFNISSPTYFRKIALQATSSSIQTRAYMGCVGKLQSNLYSQKL